MHEFWNDRYRQEEMVYGTGPNAFFREQLDALKPGRLLLPAEGEGRNAVHAAQQGWDVLAFDFSEAGRDKAMRLAAQRGVTINYLLTEAEKFDTEPGRLDAVALIYAHLPPAVRRQLHQKAVQWLKPGGVLLLEAFHPKQLDYTSGGPKDVAMLYTAGMLRDDFKQLRSDLLEEREVILEEGTHHSGASFVARLVATKQ